MVNPPLSLAAGVCNATCPGDADQACGAGEQQNTAGPALALTTVPATPAVTSLGLDTAVTDTTVTITNITTGNTIQPCHMPLMLVLPDVAALIFYSVDGSTPTQTEVVRSAVPCLPFRAGRGAVRPPGPAAGAAARPALPHRHRQVPLYIFY